MILKHIGIMNMKNLSIWFFKKSSAYMLLDWYFAEIQTSKKCGHDIY